MRLSLQVDRDGSLGLRVSHGWNLNLKHGPRAGPGPLTKPVATSRNRDIAGTAAAAALFKVLWLGGPGASESVNRDR